MANSPTAPHIYAPLHDKNTIRIIELQPALDPETPLHCSINIVSVTDIESNYEAISYTWGEPIFSHSLHCDDGTIFKITSNLHSALRRFREPVTVRRLWADSVCINQNDNDEKGWQIGMMGDIFRCAERVLVWLGENGPEEATAMKSLIYHTKHAHRNNPCRMPHDQMEGVAQRPCADLTKQLFALPWFSRRWIIQEVVLNCDVVFFCGSVQLSFLRLVSVITAPSADYLMERVDRHVRRSLLQLARLWKRLSIGDTSRTFPEFFTLLSDFNHFRCTDDRDRLFALVGLADDVSLPEAELWKPVYLDVSYLHSVEETYFNFARDNIWRCGLQIVDLAACYDSTNRRSPLPSWVPDWRLPMVRIPHRSHDSDLGSIPQCLANGKLLWEITRNDNMLITIGPEIPIDLGHSTMRDWLDACFSTVCPLHDYKLLCDTLYWARDHDNETGRLASDLRDYISHIEKGVYQAPPQTVREVFAYNRGRRMFTIQRLMDLRGSKQTVIGLGPAELQAGHTIVRSRSVAYVLEQQHRGAFRLVGDCAFYRKVEGVATRYRNTVNSIGDYIAEIEIE